MTAVIFDMDMVLCNSRTALMPALCEYFARRGVTLDFAGFRPFMGRNEKHYVKHVCEQNGLPLDPDFMDELLNIYSGMSDRIQPMPGATDTVRTLREGGHPVALASSADERKARINMDVLGLTLENDFDFYVTGDMVREAKPHPEVFLRAAEGLGLPPRLCLVVEDAENGIQAAQRAGIQVCAFTSVHPASELELLGPDFIINSLLELPDIAAGMSGI